MKKTFQAILFVLLCEAVGLLGALFTTPAIPTWYAALNKPVFSPPSFLFGPVWTTLYALMGISLWLVWRTDSQTKTKALWVFALQLLLNAAWSPVFFGARAPLAGLVVIVAMWVAIVWTMREFARISKPAAWLLLPYILWVSFASLLNYYIFRLS